MTLEEVLADWEETARRLALTGNEHDAALVRKIIQDVETVGKDYLTWLNEEDARLATGKSVRWLRQRFRGWQRTSDAKRAEDGTRCYRRIVLPRPPK